MSTDWDHDPGSPVQVYYARDNVFAYGLLLPSTAEAVLSSIDRAVGRAPLSRHPHDRKFVLTVEFREVPRERAD